MNINKAALLLSLCFFAQPDFGSTKNIWIDRQVGELLQRDHDLDERALRAALDNYKDALDSALTASPILSIVDFSKTSGSPRLWVIDLSQSRVLFKELVSHGRNSGDRERATQFSNKRGSLQSSLGLFLTAESYIGKAFGPSLKLIGLNPGLNDQALERGIVLHGATYVNEQQARESGHVGRSFGCFSVRRDIARALIDTIKNGTLIYAYHPPGATNAIST